MKVLSTIKSFWDYLGQSPESDNVIIVEILRGIYQSIYKSISYVAPVMLLFTIISILLAGTSEALREGKKNMETVLIIILLVSSIIYWFNTILAIVLEIVGII